jgi:hypothetical protein
VVGSVTPDLMALSLIVHTEHWPLVQQYLANTVIEYTVTDSGHTVLLIFTTFRQHQQVFDWYSQLRLS